MNHQDLTVSNNSLLSDAKGVTDGEKSFKLDNTFSNQQSPHESHDPNVGGGSLQMDSSHYYETLESNPIMVYGVRPGSIISFDSLIEEKPAVDNLLQSSRAEASYTHSAEGMSHPTYLLQQPQKIKIESDAIGMDHKVVKMGKITKVCIHDQFSEHQEISKTETFMAGMDDNHHFQNMNPQPASVNIISCDSLISVPHDEEIVEKPVVDNLLQSSMAEASYSRLTEGVSHHTYVLQQPQKKEKESDAVGMDPNVYKMGNLTKSCALNQISEHQEIFKTETFIADIDDNRQFQDLNPQPADNEEEPMQSTIMDDRPWIPNNEEDTDSSTIMDDRPWIPNNEEDTDSSGSEFSHSEDENYEEISECVEEEGWKFLADISSDTRPEQMPDFSDGNAGINSDLGNPPFASPGDAFAYFFDDILIETVCRWTNERAHDFFRKHPQKKMKINSLKWNLVTVRDMKVFMSLLIIMGITKMPNMHMYWHHESVFSGPPVFCGDVMSRNRFLSILKFLRFSSSKTVVKGNPRTRIEPFLDLLRKRAKTLMRPGRDVAVDEPLVILKDCGSLRQFSKSCRLRFGAKVFVLYPSEEKWHGYSWNYEIHYGKSNFKVDDPAAAKLAVSEDIVVSLVQDLLDQGRHIVTDNWYTSVRLAEYLLTRSTMITGTIHSNRGPPKKLVSEKLSKHSSAFARKNNSLLVKFQDAPTKEVLALTTMYEAGLVQKAKTYFGHKTTNFKMPLHIDKYKSLMSSVDMADQLLEPYEYGKMSLAWFKNIGIHFIFRHLLNAFIVYRNTTPHYKGLFLNFIIAVTKQWLCENSDAAATMISADERRKTGKPMKPQAEKKFHAWVRMGRKMQKRCRVCSKNDNKRKDTVYHCMGCDGEPGLCSIEHFKEWHQKCASDDSQPRLSRVSPRKKSRSK